MQNWPALSKPPIQEAILEFKFMLPSNVTKESLDLFCDELKDKFPEKKMKFIMQLTAQIQGPIGTNQNNQVTSDRVHDGYMLTSTDKGAVLQIASTGFAYHIIEPYKNWPQLLNMSKEYWDVFCKHNPGNIIASITLRFLNRIELTSDELAGGYETYFKLLPNIPDGIPSEINNFFLQLNIPDNKNELNAIINLSSGSPVNNLVKVMLDIQVSKLCNHRADSISIWDDILSLRNFKNQIFFNAITETTKLKYQ